MARTVQVDLKAGVAGYIPPVEESRKATEGLKNQVQDLDRAVNKLPADAVKAAAALKLLGTEADGAGKKVAGVGDGSTTSMTKLSDAISTARGEVKRLAEEFNRTGNTSVLDQLFNADKDLKSLEGLSKRVAGALEQGAADGGQEAGKTFTAGMQGSLSTPALGPILIGVLVAAALAAAPAMNAALLGTAGLGGIGIGIAGQFRDPQVHQALVNVGNDLMTTLTNDTGAFKAPLIAAAATFGTALKGALNSINFDNLAKDVGPLVAALGGLLGNIMPGLNKMFEAAGPIIKALGTDLAFVGNDISTMFSELASGGKGAQEALRALLMILGGLLIILGGVVLVLSKMVEWFVAAGAGVANWAANVAAAIATAFPWLHTLEDWANKVKGFFDSFNGANDVGPSIKALFDPGEAAAVAADGFDKLDQQLHKTKVTEDSFRADMAGKMFNALMSVDQATMGYERSLLTLHDTLQQNGKAIDKHTGLIADNTKAGLDNQSAILAVVQANMAQYQAQVAVGMAASDAAAIYDSNTAALEKQLRAAGYNTRQIDDMIGKYKGIPDAMNVAKSLDELTIALDRLNTAIRTLAGLPTSKEINVNVKTNYKDVFANPNSPTSQPHVNPGNKRWGGITEHAEQGLLSAKVYSPMSPARYAFAEPATGGEAFVPRHGDYGRSTDILDQASRWYGGRFASGAAMGGGSSGGRVEVSVNVDRGGQPFDRVLASAIHEGLRTGKIQIRANQLLSG